jgi:AraC-like DNA-binding protein
MQPIPFSATDLDSLMSGLEVDFVKLVECLVSPGWRLLLAASDSPGIHYCLQGTGQMIIGEEPPIDLTPHTLVIVPPGRTFKVEARSGAGQAGQAGTVESRSYQFSPGQLRRYVAGDPHNPQIVMICGYFHAAYGPSVELFAELRVSIVEVFTAADQLDHKLKTALEELLAQEVGAGAMSTALLKQVLITILRRSLSSADRWAERFVALTDRKLNRAFSDMVARPGAPHTVQTLADTAGLSRSTFMSRFTAVFGDSPMTVLRQLRMRGGGASWVAHPLTLDQVASAVGYSSRTSFHRAFQKAYGKTTTD